MAAPRTPIGAFVHSRTDTWRFTGIAGQHCGLFINKVLQPIE
jgi:hypothetical protein